MDATLEIYGGAAGTTTAGTTTIAPKLCVDCRHFIAPTCYAPENMALDLVYGGDKQPRNTVQFLRQIDGKCGPDGAWFEAK